MRSVDARFALENFSILPSVSNDKAKYFGKILSLFILIGNCQHSCRKCHSEFVRNSASIKESFSGFSQTWFGSVQFRVFRAQRSGFFDLAAS